MDGILNILKPPGMTSFDVVGHLRGILKIKRIGHTGTLDPGAVGVLPVCIGNATKAIEYLLDKDKVYRAELTLGAVTDTQDSTGKIIETFDVNVSEQQIREVVQGFTGKYLQIPPMYSAIKQDGKKLYELARNGITVEREPRELKIYSINIIDIKDNNKIIFDAACSKGTYIRTLCADIGERLGCGGHMSFLIRFRAGVFDIASSVTLEEVRALADANRLGEKLIKVDEVLIDFNKIVLDDSDSKKLLNGVSIELIDTQYASGDIVRLYNKAGKFVALGEAVLKNDILYLKSKKTFS